MKTISFPSVSLCLFFLLLGPVLSTVLAQNDSIPVDPTPDLSEQRLEDLLQDNEEESDFDLNTIFEDLAAYRENPLNLNEASEADLRELGLLSDVQISNLLNYRDQLGGFLTTYELQAIRGFDLAAVRRILPFVSLRSDVDDFQAGLGTMLTSGDNELYLRWTRFLEEARGFQPVPENPDSTPYVGDANQLYLRYRHTYSNRLSFSQRRFVHGLELRLQITSISIAAKLVRISNLPTVNTLLQFSLALLNQLTGRNLLRLSIVCACGFRGMG